MDECQGSHLPMHVAIVMDGNGRWAEAQGLPRIAGHKRGVEAVKSTVQACISKRIPVLTLFAFSRENWQRPQQEVNFLMDLFLSTLEAHLDSLIAKGVALRFIGDRSAFSPKMQSLMKDAENHSAQNNTLILNLAMNYSGRWDMVQACGKMLASNPSVVTESLLASHLSLAGLPDPDLFIRTSGEQRISNFMLFQLAYTELFFTPVAWPDFSPSVLQEALDAYAVRDRRFGAVHQKTNVSEEKNHA